MRWPRIFTFSAILVGIGLYFFMPDFGSKSAAKKHGPATPAELKAAAKSLRLTPHTKDPAIKSQSIALGKRLFFDTGFSRNGAVSCATCHRPELSFTDGKKNSAGVGRTNMNAPTLINIGSSHWFFHNGRADSLAMQALGPTENVNEHGFTRTQVVRRLKQHYRKEYESLFGPLPDVNITDSTAQTKPVKVSNEVAAYALATLGSPKLQSSLLAKANSRNIQPVFVLQEVTAGPTSDVSEFDRLPEVEQTAINQAFANFGKSIATFEATIHTNDSAFDRFADNFARTGDAASSFVAGFSQKEFDGFRLFVGEGQCALCHAGPHLTDQQFHNIGLPAMDDTTIDLGRSQGILLAKNSPFRCDGVYLKQDSPSEACKEMHFIETENSELVGAFKTPTLRNLKDTAPYGHDGRFAKITDVLIHYNKLLGKPAVGHREESLQPLDLKTSELQSLEAFLLSLQSSVESD